MKRRAIAALIVIAAACGADAMKEITDPVPDAGAQGGSGGSGGGTDSLDWVGVECDQSAVSIVENYHTTVYDENGDPMRDENGDLIYRRTELRSRTTTTRLYAEVEVANPDRVHLRGCSYVNEWVPPREELPRSSSQIASTEYVQTEDVPTSDCFTTKGVSHTGNLVLIQCETVVETECNEAAENYDPTNCRDEVWTNGRRQYFIAE